MAKFEQILLPVSSSKGESLCTHLNLSLSKVRKLIKTPGFPKPVYLSSPNPRWLTEEVDEWIKAQKTNKENDND